MTITLLALAASSPAAAFEAEVRPEDATVGERTCFRFSVDETPRPRSTVRYLGKRATTDASGDARICARPRWPGVHTAWVSRGDRRPAPLEVRARDASGVGGGSWHRLAVHYDAYGDWGGCTGTYGERSNGSCRGTFQGPGWNTTPPFHQSDGTGSLFEWGGGAQVITLTNRLVYGSFLRGFVPGPQSAAFTVTNGGSTGWLPEWGPEPWPELEPGRIQSGTDMAKVGQPGGPVRISVAYRSGGIFGRSGYIVDLNGYLWY